MEPNLIGELNDRKEQKRLKNVKEYQKRFFKNLRKYKRKLKNR